MHPATLSGEMLEAGFHGSSWTPQDFFFVSEVSVKWLCECIAGGNLTLKSLTP